MPANLPVAYKSQWDSDATQTQNDCGPASIAMILNFYGENLTTNQVFEKTGAGSGLIGIDEMVKAIQAFGYTCFRKTQSSVAELKSYLDQGLPVIALVHYGSLGATVQDKKFKGGHFFVVVGYRDDGYFVNDPNFWEPLRKDGDHHFYPKADFEKAWNDANLDGNQVRSFQVINKKSTTPTPPSGGCLIPNTSDGSALFNKLVHNSNLADDTVRYLGLAENADNVSFEQVKNSLQAREGKLTTCKNELSTRETELATAQQEVSNRIEQIGRLKDQLSESVLAKNAAETKLSEAQTKHEEELTKALSATQQLQSRFDDEAKAKGKALNELAAVKKQLEIAEKGQYTDLTFSQWLKLIWLVRFK